MTNSAEPGDHLRIAQLSQHGVLAVAGEDARAFLHGQLTNDIAHCPPDAARLAGWCSANGRLLASCLVLPSADGFLLLLARDLAGPVAKRLAMFVLRSKVRIQDASERLLVLGLWGETAEDSLRALALQPPPGAFAAHRHAEDFAVRMDAARFLLVIPAARCEAVISASGARPATEQEWTLAEIRAGRPLVTHATQDRFVPQMVNLQAIGGIDFRKGCYPGQEIVARAQYRGQVKRRMVRARVAAGMTLSAGQDLYSDDLPGQASGTVVNVAPAPAGDELLAVVPISALEAGAAIRTAPGGAALEILPLPYAG